jgi:hypothetical protein
MAATNAYSDKRNEWEQRARATKAYKLSRVLRFALEHPDLNVDDLRPLWFDHEFRATCAEHAHIRPPSWLTWEMACDLLAAG